MKGFFAKLIGRRLQHGVLYFLIALHGQIIRRRASDWLPCLRRGALSRLGPRLPTQSAHHAGAGRVLNRSISRLARRENQAVIESRIAKTVMVGSLAIFALLVTFDNLTDYNPNYEFVRQCSPWTRRSRGTDCCTGG